MRNVTLRWAEHEDPQMSNRNQRYFPDYHFEWKVLTRAPKYMRKKENKNFRGAFN